MNKQITRDEALEYLNVKDRVFGPEEGFAAATGYMNRVKRNKRTVVIKVKTCPGKIPEYTYWVFEEEWNEFKKENNNEE